MVVVVVQWRYNGGGGGGGTMVVVVVQWWWYSGGTSAVKDTLGPTILSLVGRLSYFRKLKVYCKYTLGDMGTVFCIERLSLSRRVLY